MCLKKTVLVIIIFSLLCTFVTPISAGAELSDLTGAGCESAVTHLVNLGIISGYPDGTYKPKESITRAAFAKIICLALGFNDSYEAEKGKISFSDVPVTHWAAGYINIASQKGLIKGNNGKYKPEDRISYAETLTILLRALGYGPTIESAGKWPDNYLTKATELNMITVKWNAPTDFASRGNIAILTWGMLNTAPYQSTFTLLKTLFPDYKVDTLSVHYIDIGKGDCILVKTPGGQSMLIDTGKNEDADTIINYIKLQGISRLTYLVLTHAHVDHVGAADDIINTFPVDNLYMPNVTDTTQEFKDAISAITNKNLKVTAPQVGSVFNLGEAVCTILSPSSTHYENTNDYSIVIRMRFGTHYFLFMGDATAAAEKEMAASGKDLKSDVIKVGNHGSDSSSTALLINKVLPKYAVISVNANNKYNPNSVVLNRFELLATEVLRTDKRGTIVFTTDGSNLTYTTAK